MSIFTTKMSSHCFYGNITNILNYYGITIEEAELIGLSKALNCVCRYNNEELFVGIANENYALGLSQLNCSMVDMKDYKENIFESMRELLKSGFPILLLVKSNMLNHSYIYENTNESHYIVVVEVLDQQILISDSFIQTIPSSVYQGLIDYNHIYKGIDEGIVSGSYIKYVAPFGTYEQNIVSSVKDYLMQNASLLQESSAQQLLQYKDIAIREIDCFMNKKVLSQMAYDIKVGGCIARFDYLRYLFNKYIKINDNQLNEIVQLKNEWNKVPNMLRKCSITLDREYYKKIFLIEIPKLIKREVHLYREMIGACGYDRTISYE